MRTKKALLFSVMLIVSLMIVSGCKNSQPQTQTETDHPDAEPKMDIAMAPYIEFEATVISTSPDQTQQYIDGESIKNVPKDTATVRVDRIIETGGDGEYDWAGSGISENQTTKLDFTYTVRPAKVITILGETTNEGDGGDSTVSHQVVPTTVKFENNFFVFRIDGGENTETVLPGLKVGDKFKAKIFKGPDVITVELYTIIN